MANGGFYGTREEWERMEKPLLEVDPIIQAFAKEFGLAVSKNHKDWPERSIVWGDEVRCLIQLYLVDKNSLTFNLWLCASEDFGSKRYWKHDTLITQKHIPEFREKLASLLRESRKILLDWSNNKNQLEAQDRFGKVTDITQRHDQG